MANFSFLNCREAILGDMTRGNQRELAREKNIKKQQQNKKGTELPEGMTLAQKKMLDAEIMRQKQAKALAEKQGQPLQK